MHRFYRLTIMLVVLSQAVCSRGDDTIFELNVPDSLSASDHSTGLTFRQAVPFAMGELHLLAGEVLVLDTDSLSGYGVSRTLWPDGSVQWLLVTGTVETADQLPQSLSVKARKSEFASLQHNAPAKSGYWAEADAESIGLENAVDGTRYRLRPVAQMMRVNQPVNMEGNDPDYIDRRGQYLWAGKVTELHSDPERIELKMTVTEASAPIVEAEKTVYCFKGIGEEPQVKGHLEWQLMVEVNAHSPVVRMEMTWGAFWDEQQWALAGASWLIESETIWKGIGNGELDEEIDEHWFSASDPAGRTISLDGSQLELEAGYVVLLGDEGSLGLALPTFSKMGPNRIEIKPRQIAVHCWDPQSGFALDLRHSGDSDEFNMNPSDVASRPIGVSRTIELSLVPGKSVGEIAELSRALASRDDQWLPSAAAIVRTGALGPIDPQVLVEGQDYLEGLLANIHFLLRSQEHWRWYGFINYGDVRTNFAIGRNEDRGLYPLRWSLYGRYGWRNGSGDVPNGLLRAGLLLEDRELVLRALDYARHVVDVDMVNPSHYGDQVAGTGGLHRRNRDHWSGSVQMQYSPSNGLYLASWISDSRRIREGLEALRQYALRGINSHSAFAAQAWINYYRETHDSDALRQATALLSRSAEAWRARDGVDKEGLAALYQGNFRWQSDGVRTLFSFYEATGDESYLQLIAEVLVTEIERDDYRRSMGLPAEAVLGYLVGAGKHADAIPVEFLTESHAYMDHYLSVVTPDRSEWSYDRLVEFLLKEAPNASSPVYRESNAIGSRAFNAFYALNLLMLDGKDSSEDIKE